MFGSIIISRHQVSQNFGANSFEILQLSSFGTLSFTFTDFATHALDIKLQLNVFHYRTVCPDFIEFYGLHTV